ncbi:MAG: GNAT family N-acetyltransferase [Brevinema sp.]
MIRLMLPTDQSYITPLLYTMYQEHQKISPFYITKEVSFEHIQSVWDKIFTHPHYYHFVYEKNNQVIAYMGLSLQKAHTDFIYPEENSLILDNLIVHPSYQRQGIATQLIVFAKSFTADLGIKFLDLYVSLPYAQKFYHQQGFYSISQLMSYQIPQGDDHAEK